jgi:hypothetical protein
LFARLRKTINGVSQLFDSATARVQTINVQEISAFNWVPSDTTVTPSTPGAATVTFGNASVTIDWPDAANATEYTSTISGGTQGFRTFTTPNSIDSWAVSNGGVAYSGSIRSRNTNGRILIDWPAVSGAGSYRVLFEISGSVSNVLTTSTQYTITTTTGTAISNIRVRAYANTAGTGVFREGSAVPFPTTQTPQPETSGLREWSGVSQSVPATPTGLSATATSTSSVSLSWNAAARATTYEWYWNLSGTTPTTQGADFSGLTGTSATHGSRSSGTTYYYWVRARNSIGVSGWSARDSATTFVAVPSTPTGVSVSGGGLVTWNAVAGATSYNVQHQSAATNTGSNAGSILTSGDISGTSFTIPFVSGRLWRRARVRANNSAGSSSYSSFTGYS